MTVASYTVPNLIQGVSQQSPEQRRATQLEAQENCLNSPKDGCVPRPGVDYLKEVAPGGDFTDAAFHEIFYATEHYLVVIPRTSTTGTLKVYDLADGTECTVTGVTSGPARLYLASGTMLARHAFRFQTVDDYTFIGNRLKVIAMTTAVQATRPPEALVFVKAGGYSQKYTLSIVYAGNKYTWTYETPDNSVVANAPFISTAQIAATFYRALTGNAAPVPTSGAADSGTGVVGMYPGSTTGVTGSITATSLGFSVDIRGNVLRIWRNADSNAFSIDCGDSVGNTFMTALKDKARALSDLPERAFPGFRLNVAGVSNKDADDYYIEYTANDVWMECAGGGVATTLDKTTMPHALINTGYRTFSFGAVDWSTRLVGDNLTAPLAYFVGTGIQTLLFHQERLGIVTDGAYDFSKARNTFSFFRDTVQTVLATDPVSSPVSGSKSISLLRRAVRIDEGVFLWAQGAQYRLTTGDQGFKQDGVETKLSTAYDFAEDCQPLAVGSGLYFTTDGDLSAAVRHIVFSGGGRPGVAIDVTEHCPSYIPKGTHHLAASETLGMMFVLTSGFPTGLYHYSFVIKGQEVVQSAWDKWGFPVGDIGWVSEYKSRLYVAAYRGTKLFLGSMPLTTHAVDPGGLYLTRLDFRMTEAQVTKAYNAGLNQTTITLPTTLPASVASGLRVVIRTTGSPFTRGENIPIISEGASSVVVGGDLTAAQFYVGVLIQSKAELSKFYPRGPDGAAAFGEDLKVHRLYISHTNTYAYTVQVSPNAGGPLRQTVFTAPTTGPPANGILNVPIQERAGGYQAVLINNGFLPSAWQRIKVAYEMVDRFARDPNV